MEGKPCYHEIFQTVEGAKPLLSLKPGENIPYSLTGYVLKTEGIIGHETPSSEKIISKKSGRPLYKVYGIFVKFGSQGLFSSASSYHLKEYGKYAITVSLKDANTMSDMYGNLKPEERVAFFKDKWQGTLTSNTITIEVVEKKANKFILDLKFNHEKGKKSWWTFTIDDNEFASVDELKEFLKGVPSYSVLEFAPGCVRRGDEPLINSESEMKAFRKFCEDNGISFNLIPSG